MKNWEIRLFLTLGWLFLAGAGSGWGEDWSPPSWGLTLQELDLAVKEKNKTFRIEEDKTRAEIELQYTPAKSIKIKRGKVTAWLSSTDPSMPGRLYGYAFEGNFFGRVIFFKDHPELFPETVFRTLKEHYPEGKISRGYSQELSQSFFEYKSGRLYLFSNNRGVYYYDPNILEKVVRIESGRLNEEEERIQKKVKMTAPQSRD
ncbi:MAG: hypothetical protein AB1585_19785 [Thermodesulfobacteriota bacterium]